MGFLATPIGKLVVTGLVAGTAGEVARPVLAGIGRGALVLAGVDPAPAPSVGDAEEDERRAGSITRGIGDSLLWLFAPDTWAQRNEERKEAEARARARALPPAERQILSKVHEELNRPKPAIEAPPAAACNCKTVPETGDAAPCACGGKGVATAGAPETGSIWDGGDNRRTRQAKARASRAEKKLSQMEAAEKDRQATERLAQMEARLQAQAAAATGQLRADLEKKIRATARLRIALPGRPQAERVAVADQPPAWLGTLIDKLSERREGPSVPAAAAVQAAPPPVIIIPGQSFAPQSYGYPPPGYPPPGYPPPGYPQQQPAQQQPEEAQAEEMDPFAFADMLAESAVSGTNTEGVEDDILDMMSGGDEAQGVEDDILDMMSGGDEAEGVEDDILAAMSGVEGEAEGVEDDMLESLMSGFDFEIDGVEPDNSTCGTCPTPTR